MNPTDAIAGLPPEDLDDEPAPATPKGPGRTWLALAIVAAVLLTLASAWRQGWFTPTSHVFLELPGAGGVQIGSPVRLKGFKIGEVDGITLEKNLTVRVRLRLDTDKMELLGSDAHARFGRDSPIAGKHIELQPGQRDGPRLVSGKVVPVDAGSELEDVMATLKGAAEQLSTTLGKIDPILDDTRKLTTSALALRDSASGAVNETLANVQALSGQLKQMSQAANAMLGHLDQDRARVVDGLQGVLKQADAAASSAGKSLAVLEGELPRALGTLNETLDHTRAITVDLRQVLTESRDDIAPLIRSARDAARDASETTQRLKSTWPLSTGGKPADTRPLALDSFEAVPP